jgi:hypothetical protein
MLRTSFWGADNYSPIQAIPYLVWIRKFHCCVHKIPSLHSIKNQLNPLHTLHEIHLNINLLSMTSSPGVLDQSVVQVVRCPHACCLSHPLYCSWSDHPNNNTWMYKYEVRQYINVSSSRLLYLSYILDIVNPRHTVIYFLGTKDPVSHSYTTAGFSYFILIFIVLRWETERFSSEMRHMSQT